MSAMGERFLILEETADALDVIDPELAVHFRTVNGLQRVAPEELLPGAAALSEPSAVASHHEIRMDVGDDHIRSDCSCGAWSYTVGWDEIDVMVAQVREHVGSARAPAGGAMAGVDSAPATAVANQAG
jgi:hypothetical protein